MRLPELFAISLLHGPAELLPISSSAHVGLLLSGLDPEERKELEVAVHAGTLVALGPPAPRAWLIASTLPPAVAGFLLERRIERLGPRWTAFGLLAGSAVMAAADTRPTPPPPTRAGSPPTRAGSPPARAGSPPARAGSDPSTLRGLTPIVESPGTGLLRGLTPSFGEGFVVGVAQAAALVPGVSRLGVTLAALRALGYGREEATVLSREASRPVLLGAVVLKGSRAVRRGAPVAPLAVAALGSFLSTKAALKVVGAPPLWPFALYRAALAASVLRRG